MHPTLQEPAPRSKRLVARRCRRWSVVRRGRLAGSVNGRQQPQSEMQAERRAPYGAEIVVLNPTMQITRTSWPDPIGVAGGVPLPEVM